MLALLPTAAGRRPASRSWVIRSRPAGHSSQPYPAPPSPFCLGRSIWRGLPLFASPVSPRYDSCVQAVPSPGCASCSPERLGASVAS